MYSFFENFFRGEECKRHEKLIQNVIRKVLGEGAIWVT